MGTAGSSSLGGAPHSSHPGKPLALGVSSSGLQCGEGTRSQHPAARCGLSGLWVLAGLVQLEGGCQGGQRPAEPCARARSLGCAAGRALLEVARGAGLGVGAPGLVPWCHQCPLRLRPHAEHSPAPGLLVLISFRNPHGHTHLVASVDFTVIFPSS